MVTFFASMDARCMMPPESPVLLKAVRTKAYCSLRRRYTNLVRVNRFAVVAPPRQRLRTRPRRRGVDPTGPGECEVVAKQF
jgi:hypothetical protein